jgi:hypothetical protein
MTGQMIQMMNLSCGCADNSDEDVRELENNPEPEEQDE